MRSVGRATRATGRPGICKRLPWRSSGGAGHHPGGGWSHALDNGRLDNDEVLRMLDNDEALGATVEGAIEALEEYEAAAAAAAAGSEHAKSRRRV